MVVLGRGELFTGNCLLFNSYLERKKQVITVLQNWAIVYGGNFLGTLFLALLYKLSGLSRGGEGVIAQRILSIAQGKVALPFLQGFVQGILCNWLVCLAIFLVILTENSVEKILAIPGPITTFVALGYEHSVANMYFLAMGIFESEGSGIAWGKALLQNLLPVTLGNIVGGSILVGMLYHLMSTKRQ